MQQDRVKDCNDYRRRLQSQATHDHTVDKLRDYGNPDIEDGRHQQIQDRRKVFRKRRS